MRLNPSDIIANRYEIIEKLGVGGMAVVYKAKDTMLDRFVTFKVLKEEHLSDPEVSSNFGTEAKAAARLNNQNIVRVFDTGIDEHVEKNSGNRIDVNYIVMEYIDGKTIKELIKERSKDKRFTESEALGVSLQIAKALAHAHENNVVHRDIKPQNILITTEGDVKVTDFGIALRFAHSDTTILKESMGSVHYSSPEQARGRFVDGRSDIYSLGIVMFEMITGRLPFEGDSSVTVALKHVNEPLPEISNLSPEISEKFINIIKKCTAKIANQRYNNAYELVDDLKRLLEAKAKGEDYEDYLSEEQYDDYEDNNEAENHFENPTIKFGRGLDRTLKKELESEEDRMITALGGTIRNGGKDLDTKSKTALKDNSYSLNESKNWAGKNNQNLKIAAIAGVFVLAFIFIVLIIFLINRNTAPTVQIMPNIVGMNYQQINTRFQGYDIVININEYPNDSVEAGLAFSQSINEGAVIEPGTLLDVGISLGIINITVPNLIGLPLSEAQLIIEEYSSLNFESLNEPHVTVPVGTIFIQTPMPGDQIAFNETVTFSISTGPPTGDEVIVPNFFGIEASVLPQMVEEAGLALGNISFTSNNMPEGLVINQTIPVGSAVLQGHVINFVVSTGPIVETPTIIEPTPDPPAAEPEDEPHEEEPIEDEPIEDIISEEEPSEDDNGEEDIPEVPVTQTTVTIPMPVLDEDQTLVFANIIFQSDLAGNQLLLYRAVDISEFPFQFTVEGSGTVIFWADGDLVSSQSVQ